MLLPARPVRYRRRYRGVNQPDQTESVVAASLRELLLRTNCCEPVRSEILA